MAEVQGGPGENQTKAGPVPILLDTDIGGDIDDALALAYLLRQSRCHLLGVTTVGAKPVERAKLVSAIALAEGRSELPVQPGSGQPLLVRRDGGEPEQAAVLADHRHRQDLEPASAVPFLRQAIRKRPGEVTLLTIGPLTNVALLFTLDPEIPRLLKRLVMMVGRFGEWRPGWRAAEWNARCDPHATAVVFQAPVPELVAYGLDVTMLCEISRERVRAGLAAAGLDVVLDMANLWYGKRPYTFMHDPLAAASIFAADLCEYEQGRVAVDLASPRHLLKGFTHFDPDPVGPHRVASGVEPERLFTHYFNVVGN